MKYIEINGKKAAFAALGSSEFGGKMCEGLARDILDRYAALGGNFLDTARVYGDFVTPRNGESEKVIGRWLKGRPDRETFFLSTKGGHHVLGTKPVGRLSYEELYGDISESLENLQTDCVDIYWLHRDNPAFSVGEVAETLQRFIEDGKTRLIGASNWSTERIGEFNNYARSHGLTPFYGNQPQFSLARQTEPDDCSLVQADKKMLEMHLQTGMLMTPYSSQAKGFLTKLDTLGEAGLSDKAKRRFYTPGNLAIYRRAREVSEKTGVSVGALAILWLTCQPFPLVPIIGISKPAQLDTLAEAAQAELSAADRDYISALY